MSVSIGELAVRFGCELRGDPGVEVQRVATLSGADGGAVAFLANPRYRAQLAGTRAAAVVLDAASAGDCPVAALVCQNPHATYARIAALLHPRPAAPPGIHPSAVVDPGAEVDPSAHIGALCHIGAGAVIGARAFVGPQSLVAEQVVLGEDVQLLARVSLCRGVVVGARTMIQPGAVIGADGFGFAAEHGRWIKVPQIGGVRIGADVEIGANTTIDRGALEDTVIEDGVKLDNQIQVGHNVCIGAHSALAGCVGIAGSARIGRRCTVGGGSVILGHIAIADGVNISAGTLVAKSITRAGNYTGTVPFLEHADWLKNFARLRHLDAMADKIRALEAQVARLAEQEK